MSCAAAPLPTGLSARTPLEAVGTKRIWPGRVGATRDAGPNDRHRSMPEGAEWMSLKDIVVLLDPSPAGEERLRLATRIARDQEAYLSAVFVRHHQAVDAGPVDVLRRGVADPAPADVRAASRATQDGRARSRTADARSLRWFGGDGDWHEVEPGRVGEAHRAHANRRPHHSRSDQSRRSARTVMAAGRDSCRLWTPGPDGPLCRDLSRTRAPRSGRLGRIARGNPRTQ